MNSEQDNQPKTQIIPVFFENMPVRIVDNNGEHWWVARDICDILELGHITNALKGLDDDELTVMKLQSGGQKREMKVINESGLYSLIFNSRKPQAKIFKRWVTREVLPSIRKTGSYSIQSALVPPAVVERIERLEQKVQDVQMNFNHYGPVWAFAYYCCKTGGQRDIAQKDELYNAYVDYCQASYLEPECKSHFCMKIYRAVPGSGPTTITVNGQRVPAVRGFTLLPGYKTLIEDKRREVENSNREELKRRRQYYFGIKENADPEA